MTTELAATIKAVREDLRLDVPAFAKAMNRSARTVYRWEAGQLGINKGWQRKKLLDLTAKLGTPAVAQLRNIFARDGIIAMEKS